MVLNKNPENYHREVEQAAFSPGSTCYSLFHQHVYMYSFLWLTLILGSMVPGIEPSPDPLLQFRMWFYRDTQMYRLGVNMHEVNPTLLLVIFASCLVPIKVLKSVSVLSN